MEEEEEEEEGEEELRRKGGGGRGGLWLGAWRKSWGGNTLPHLSKKNQERIELQSSPRHDEGIKCPFMIFCVHLFVSFFRSLRLGPRLSSDWAPHLLRLH